jgi:hypothetical protein
MTKAIALAGLIVATAFASSSVAADCSREPARNFRGVPVWRSGPAIGFATSGLAVDADGAPDSYRVDGKGLSRTCDGVSAKRNGVQLNQYNDKAGWQQACAAAWEKSQRTGDYSQVDIVGFNDNCPGPCIQGEGDPFPGQAYITATSMSVPGTPLETQRHYVNASKIPYIVLDHKMADYFHINLDDIAAIYRPKTGALAYGV